MFSSILLLVPFLAGINAANDWSVPCTSGECSYDLPATNTSASGTLKIWGSTDAITDITKAADWQILGCDPNALTQDIRLNFDAVNKLVRLPENCGASAFARIAKAWVPEDQSIPGSIKSRIVRRDGKVPVVKALALDVNFDAVDYSKTGVVHIAIQGANVPGASTDIQTPGSRRSSGSRRAVGKAIGKAAAAPPIVSTGTAAGTVSSGSKSAADSLKDNIVDVSKTTLKLKPLTLNKKVTLINKSVSCGPAGGTLKVDMAANAKAQASITVAAKGTVVPPNISVFSLVAGVTANIGGTVTMKAGLSGRIDSGSINLITLAVPGLNFPGILTVGPTLKVDTQVVGDVQVPVDMSVGMNFVVNNAQLAFPPTGPKPSASAFSIGDMPLTLSAAGGIKATGTVTAHLTPSLNLGVDGLGGKAKAQIFLSFDTNAALTMNLDAAGALKKVTNVKSAIAPKKTAAAVKKPVVAKKPAAKKPVAVKKPVAKKVVAKKPVAVKKPVVKKPVAKAPVKKVAPKKIAAPRKKVKVSVPKKKKARTTEEDIITYGTAEDDFDIVDETAYEVKPRTLDDDSAINEDVSDEDASDNDEDASDDDTSDDEDDDEDALEDDAPEDDDSEEDDTELVTLDSRATAAAAAKKPAAAKKTPIATLSGCVKVAAGINVNAGAAGSFFGVFNKSTKASLFSKNFNVFTKCFGKKAARRSMRSMPRVSRLDRVRRAALSCPIGGGKKTTLSAITTGTVRKASIKAA
ncbi:hypothetical protein DFH09DRAFT_1372201 [Mycena vulgaris]|nr:hypothetical protein DFH09DRAFT_1372201 [Mycena vulgaris]